MEWYKGYCKLIKQTIKKPESLQTSYWKDDELRYVLTKNSITGIFYLYEFQNNTLVKMKCKSKSPLDLEKNINWEVNVE